jgi:hypothetical protein
LHPGRCARAVTNLIVADDDAVADVRHPHDRDNAPLGSLHGDQGVYRGDGRPGAAFQIAHLESESGVFGG